MENANRILNQKVFNVDDWKVIGEYVHDNEGGRHQAFYSPKKDVSACGVLVKEGERVQVEQSLKYSDEEVRTLWKQAGLKPVAKWSASTVDYSKFISKSVLRFPILFLFFPIFMFYFKYPAIPISKTQSNIFICQRVDGLHINWKVKRQLHETFT